MALFLVPFSSLVLLYIITVLNNIIVLITRSCLSIAKVSSSFIWLDTRMSMLTTPTLITEALCHVTSLQLFKMPVTVK